MKSRVILSSMHWLWLRSFGQLVSESVDEVPPMIVWIFI